MTDHKPNALEDERFARLVAAFRQAIRDEGFLRPEDIKKMISAGMQEYLRDPTTMTARKAVFAAAFRDMLDETAKEFGWFSIKWLGVIALLGLLWVGAKLKGWM